MTSTTCASILSNSNYIFRLISLFLFFFFFSKSISTAKLTDASNAEFATAVLFVRLSHTRALHSGQPRVLSGFIINKRELHRVALHRAASRGEPTLTETIAVACTNLANQRSVERMNLGRAIGIVLSRRHVAYEITRIPSTQVVRFNRTRGLVDDPLQPRYFHTEYRNLGHDVLRHVPFPSGRCEKLRQKTIERREEATSRRSRGPCHSCSRFKSRACVRDRSLIYRAVVLCIAPAGTFISWSIAM